MQAKMKTKPFDFFDPVFDGAFEAPIDAEYNLPDYCPDIQKILKCQVSPEISSYLVTEDVLSCDGVCDVRVLYLDAKGDRVRCCDFTKDFSASVKVKAMEDKAVAWVEASMEHCTCRAVSARRIDLHAAISLKAVAVTQKQEQITCDIEDSSVEKMSGSFQASQAVNALCHQFTLEDTVSLKNGKPPMEAILHKEVVCRVSGCRFTEGQMTVNGTVSVSFLYLSSDDGGSVEKMTADLDFSQPIECNGASEGCLCNLKAVVGESSIQPKEDDVGEYTSAGVVVKVFLTAFLYRSCEVEIIDDAYSVRAPLDLRCAQAAFTQVCGIHEESLKKKCVLNIQEDGVEKILDLWCEQDGVQTACDKGKVNYRVRCTLCMLYLGAGGRILYTEKAFDFNAAAELEDDRAKKGDTYSHTEVWEYRIADRNTVEVSVETRVSTFLYSRETVKYLVSAEVGENAQPYEKSPGLTVYYASQGERLWDVAKSHHALLSDIRAQNDLYEETVPEPRPIILCSR